MNNPNAARLAGLLHDLEASTLKMRGYYISYKTIVEYRSRLWQAAVRLFNGGRDANFLGSFARTIDQQLTEAWNAGAEEVGVMPDEMSADDINILRTIINNESLFVERLANDIQAAKDGGMSREQFDKQFGSRVDLWANRYLETVNRARMVFGSKLKFEWVEGPTSDKCPFCMALDGIVAFGYEWEETRFHPQMAPNPTLTGEYHGGKGCEGWGCECQLKPTNKRRTSRALDRLTQIAAKV